MPAPAPRPPLPAAPYNFAIGQTSANGEIKALDPANYGGVTIAKSISITGVEGAGIDRAGGPVAITITAGANDVVNLSRLTLDGLKIAQTGILLNSGGSLTIAHCTVRNFTNDGIHLQPVGAAKFLIAGTLVSENAAFGIVVHPLGTGSAQGTLDYVSANKNGNGIFVDRLGTTGVADVTAVDSMATNNNAIGFAAQGNFADLRGLLRLAHSAATGNGTGVQINLNGTVESFVDNAIRGNTLDVSGTLTTVPTQLKTPARRRNASDPASAGRSGERRSRPPVAGRLKIARPSRFSFRHRVGRGTASPGPSAERRRVPRDALITCRLRDRPACPPRAASRRSRSRICE